MLSSRTRTVLILFVLLSAISSIIIFATSEVKHPGMFLTVVLTLVGTAIVGRIAIAFLFGVVEKADDLVEKASDSNESASTS